MFLRHLPWLLAMGACGATAAPQAVIVDLAFQSRVFGEERNFRVFLPPDYDKAVEKRYPVIYFFHGWSERHNGPPRGRQGYDAGNDYGGDNIAAFVGRHDVIVVKWDGYNPRTPGEAYLRPYNISPVETHRQFPPYFVELVRHIDERFRTIPDRDHRATAGLSMGGFMSFWIAGKYPHLVGSASNFMGSSEFYVGPNASPTEYRHTEMYRNYEGLRTRLVLGSRDFIRWYHQRMNAVWDYTRPHHEHEEFDWDHGTPGMAKTLSFHMDAFRRPLPAPAQWHHVDVYPDFDVWGYSVSSDRRQPGYTVLENVSATGFRSSVREWLPGGRILPSVALRIATKAEYRPGAAYRVTDVNLDSGETRESIHTADREGRLRFLLDGARHEIGIAPSETPLLTVAGWRQTNGPWATAGEPVELELEILNKGAAAARSVSIETSTTNPGVVILSSALNTGPLRPGERGKASPVLRFTVQDPEREIVRFQVRLTAPGGATFQVPLEVALFRRVGELDEIRILDGAAAPIWERAVASAERVLGRGNGNGVANPGESVAIAVRDGRAWRAVELFSSDKCIDLTERLSDPWASYDNVGATAKISLAGISGDCADGHVAPLFVRYQIPDKPNHVLKEGVFRLKIQRQQP